MTTPVSRREFVKSTARAACAALVVGFDPIARSWITAIEITPLQPLVPTKVQHRDLPDLFGETKKSDD